MVASIIQAVFSFLLIAGSFLIKGDAKDVCHGLLGIPVMILCVVVNMILIVSHIIIAVEMVNILTSFGFTGGYLENRITWLGVQAVGYAVSHSLVYFALTMKVRSTSENYE